jgi:hypothetical protein
MRMSDRAAKVARRRNDDAPHDTPFLNIDLEMIWNITVYDWVLRLLVA